MGEDGGDAIDGTVAAEPAAGEEAVREVVDGRGEVRGEGEEGGAVGFGVEGGGEEMIVEDVDEDAGDTAAGGGDAGAALDGEGVGVGKAIEFAMELEAETEFDGLDLIETAFDEIAEEVAEGEQATIGDDEQVAEVIHVLLF